MTPSQRNQSPSEFLLCFLLNGSIHLENWLTKLSLLYRGGLGLTTGICDVGSLIDCLYGIDSGDASLDILAKYDEIRRQIFNQVVDVMSTTNFKRIMQDADEFKEKDTSCKMMMAARADANVAMALREVSPTHLTVAAIPYLTHALLARHGHWLRYDTVLRQV